MKQRGTPQEVPPTGEQAASPQATIPGRADTPTMPMTMADEAAAQSETKRGRGKATPAAPARVSLPKTVVCPVSGTVFNPRTTGGRCPVCGEQVVPAELVARANPATSIGNTRPGQWLFANGGWRVSALIVLVLYQLGLFLWVLIQLVQKHAF